MEGRKHLYILILAVLSFCPSFLPAMSERNLRILSELDQTISQKLSGRERGKLASGC